MAYPIPTPATVAAARPSAAAGRVTSLLAIVAGALYLAGYYLPMISFMGSDSSISDGSNKALWVWVAPAALAMVAGLVGLSGNVAAGAIGAGLAVGTAGFTTLEVIIIHKITALGADESFGSFDKGIGFWCWIAAVAVSVVAALSMEGNKAVDEPRADAALAGIAALVFLGVPLSILLPKHGVSVFDIDDGLVKFGYIVWAVLPALFAMRMVSTRRRSGLAFGAGVALAELGLTAALLQHFSNDSETLGSMLLQWSSIYHWSAGASLALTLVALARATAPQQPPVTYPVTAYQPAPYATQPVAQPVAQPQSQPQVQGQWAPDPYRRHQYRLWDGQQWTANVSDNGVVGFDPV